MTAVPDLARTTCLLAVIGLAGCSSEDERVASVERPNVLLIAVDTLRADKLDCYGTPRGLTPEMDRLADGGARFEHCFAHAPWTLPSFASLLTSTLPQAHGAGGNVRDGGFLALADRATTLAECLGKQGFACGAIVNVDFLGPTFGLMQGFRDVDAKFTSDDPEIRDATATTDAALSWLDHNGQERFFLFVHYFDPHAEYAPPQPFRGRWADPRDREATTFAFGAPAQIAAHRSGVLPLDARDVRRAEKLYDGEIAYTDSEIGRLLDGLERRGLDARTLVVLTSDHGEEFADHGDYEHGHTLYDELLHVPLIASQPGRLLPQVISDAVGHVDVATFICAWVGAVPAPSFTGRDLRLRVTGGALAPGTLIAYGSFWGEALHSIREREHKLIEIPAATSAPAHAELYDWRTDPRESHDLAREAPDLARRMAEDLRLVERALAPRGPAPRAELTAAERARLQSLGYSSGDGN